MILWICSLLITGRTSYSSYTNNEGKKKTVFLKHFLKNGMHMKIVIKSIRKRSI